MYESLGSLDEFVLRKDCLSFLTSLCYSVLKERRSQEVAQEVSEVPSIILTNKSFKNKVFVQELHTLFSLNYNLIVFSFNYTTFSFLKVALLPARILLDFPCNHQHFAVKNCLFFVLYFVKVFLCFILVSF